eukprot:5643050-Prymnesium_polylepis.1
MAPRCRRAPVDQDRTAGTATMDATGGWSSPPRSERMIVRDVVERHVEAAVQRGSRLVGGQHRNVRAGSGGVQPTFVLSPAAAPVVRQTPTSSLNMPSRRLNGNGVSQVPIGVSQIRDGFAKVLH